MRRTGCAGTSSGSAEPLRLAVAGLPQTGRSTLVNSLVGEEIAPLLVEEGSVLTWYRGGAVPRAQVYPTQAPPRDAPVARVDGRLHIDLEGWRAETLDRIVVDWPSRALRGLTLIDTPAIGAEPAEPATSTSDAATDVASRISLDADAVLYLMRNLHSTDVGFLQSIQDHPIARETPVNASSCCPAPTRSAAAGSTRSPRPSGSPGATAPTPGCVACART